jgi:asparagine synthase (glutamine-hydrolysing)
LNFINQLSEEVEFDKLAISQFLTFGFLLNNRTLYENINQLRPASLVRIHDNTVQIQNMFKFNFQNRANENKNIKEVINDLHDLFSTSCKNRFKNDNKNVVALSGGLDSRLVVSSMFYNKIPFSTITFVHKYGSVINDEQIAVQLANIFNVHHNTVQINPPSGLDVYKQLKIKEGMNSLFTSYLHSFYYKVNEVFGNKINLITGDNGDKLIFTLDKPIRKFGSDDELSEYILNQHSILEPEMILQLTNLRKNEMLNEIVSLLKTFPEENLWNKYVHFKVSERPFKFAFQGEDRHRSFFWNISPFWSFPFYNYLMNCTDKIKKNHKVFGGLIKSFSDEAIKLPYSNFKSSIVSLKGKVALSFLYNVYPKIPKNLKTKFKVGILGWNPNVKNDSILIQCIKRQRKSCNEISNYLNLDSNFNLESMGKATLFNVLTLTSVIEDYFKEESTIEQFPDREFI